MIEIAGLDDHLIDECEGRENYKLCSKCRGSSISKNSINMIVSNLKLLESDASYVGKGSILIMKVDGRII